MDIYCECARKFFIADLFILSIRIRAKRRRSKSRCKRILLWSKWTIGSLMPVDAFCNRCSKRPIRTWLARRRTRTFHRRVKSLIKSISVFYVVTRFWCFQLLIIFKKQQVLAFESLKFDFTFEQTTWGAWQSPRRKVLAQSIGLEKTKWGVENSDSFKSEHETTKWCSLEWLEANWNRNEQVNNKQLEWIQPREQRIFLQLFVQ